MIIKGHSSTGRGLGAYLMQDKNDRAEVLGIRGDMPRDLMETLEDWCSDSLGTNCTKPLYHAQINPDRVLSSEEWEKAVEIFEKEMGFENQPRAVVLHEYKGREHYHLVYSRIDEEGKAISDSWNYLHHEKAAREIERELGLEITQGVFIDREGPRPERTPSHAEIQQAERLDLDPKAIKAEVSELYQSAENGRAFIEALEAEGYTLAQGDQRGFVIIDQAGGVHSLSRMAGVKVGELRETLSDYPLQDLPTVGEAREMQQERQQSAQRPEYENELPAPDRQPQAAPQIEQAPTLAAPESGSREEGREAAPAPEAATASAAEIDRAAPDGREAATPAPDFGDNLERGIGGAADAGIKILGKTLDAFASSFESLFESSPPPPPTREQIAKAEAQADDRAEAMAQAREEINRMREFYDRAQSAELTEESRLNLRQERDRYRD